MGTRAETPFSLSSPDPGQFHHFPQSRLRQALLPYTGKRFLCGSGATLLFLFAGCSLLSFWTQVPLPPALAATGCPISGLPPTPTSASLADPNSIKFNELLSNPKTDWDCDGDIGAKNQWTELINLSSADADLSHLEVLSQNSNNDQPVLLSSTERISAHGFLAIFIDQINAPLSLFPGGGTLELLNGDTGAIVDSVNYPALGVDQSYMRDDSGQWTTSDTPTPGAANTANGPASPTPTATHHTGGGGGDTATPTATPTPMGSVFIPTDTPGSLALQNPGNSSPSGGSGGGSGDATLPAWLKITLLALMGAGLLGVVIWYFRSWGQTPEGDT